MIESINIGLVVTVALIDGVDYVLGSGLDVQEESDCLFTTFPSPVSALETHLGQKGVHVFGEHAAVQPVLQLFLGVRGDVREVQSQDALHGLPDLLHHRRICVVHKTVHLFP